MNKLLTVLAVSFVPVIGQQIPGQYIVELVDEPAIVTAGRKAGPRAALADTRAVIPEMRTQARAAQQRVRDGIGSRARVLRSMTVVSNSMAVQADAKDVPFIASLPGVKRVIPDF